MPSSRPVGPVDRMWLDMDRPTNLMVIEAVMWFDAPVDWNRLVAVLDERLIGRYPVLRQRPVSTPLRLGYPRWEDDPEFDLGRHIRTATLPTPGDQSCLQRYVEGQMQQPLPRSRPLWEFHLVDGYDGGSAVLTRFHHSLADGLALTEVLLSLTDPTPAGAPDRHLERTGYGGRRVVAHRRGPLRRVVTLPRYVHPARAAEAITLARQTLHVADKLLLGSTPATPLTGEPGVAKRAVWSSARPLADVKRIGRLAAATVNDVIMSAVTGAVATYLVEHGGEATDLTTMVPVNLRPVGQPLPPELGNRFALVLVPLPAAARTPLGRLTETKRRMDSIKHSPEATITFGLINAIGLTHPRMERLLVDFFAGKAFGVTTNVIAPPRERYVAGSRIAGLLGWVPGSGRQAVGVCTVTYDQTLRVGFKVDAAIVPDPDRLVQAFDLELDRLLHMTRAA
jgi:WS/DGAT/MGAT family acyltransferase